jgi:hypothetical protein
METKKITVKITNAKSDVIVHAEHTIPAFCNSQQFAEAVSFIFPLYWVNICDGDDFIFLMPRAMQMDEKLVEEGCLPMEDYMSKWYPLMQS